MSHVTDEYICNKCGEAGSKLFGHTCRTPKPCCQLGDLKPGHRYVSVDGLREFIVTNHKPGDDWEGKSVVVDLESGALFIVENSLKLGKTRNGRLRLI